MSFGALYKIFNVKNSKGYSSSSFHPISAKLYGKYENQGGSAVTFDDLPGFKPFMGLILFAVEHMGLEISKRYSQYTFQE